jgi:hypothetical protein
MEKEKKITKQEYLMQLITVVENSNIENKNELIYFLNSQIESLKNKADKAKLNAAKKKEEGDDLRKLVQAKLTNDYQTADEILAQLDFEDATIAKVRARLTQLVDLGLAEKSDITTEDKKIKKAYKIA